jgi:hypothetical protein
MSAQKVVDREGETISPNDSEVPAATREWDGDGGRPGREG